MKELNDRVPYQVADNIWWLGFSDEETGFSNNPYLLIDGEEAVLFDPGPGHHIFRDIIFDKIQKITDMVKIKYLVVHHQDPDLCGLLPFIENFCSPSVTIVAHPRTALFVPYYGTRKPVMPVGDNDTLVLKSGRRIRFIHTPYLHFAGSMMSYDEQTGTLFSSDIFGSFSKDWSLFADESYIDGAKRFIENYIAGTREIDFAYNRLKTLNISMILPQHGAVIQKELVSPMIEMLKSVKPGRMIDELTDIPSEEDISYIVSEGREWFKQWLNEDISADSIDDLLSAAIKHSLATLAMIIENISTTATQLSVKNPLTIGRDLRPDIHELKSSSGLVDKMRRRFLTNQYRMEQADAENLDAIILRRLQAVDINAVIAFVDIREFTQWCNGRLADEIVSMLNKQLEAIVNLITWYGGRVNKLMGDGILAYFTEDRIDDAVLCAINIHEMIKADDMLPVGIGLCFGKVILGDIGQFSRLDYTLIGSTVNLASRFCSLAEKWQTVVSANLIEKLKPQILDNLKSERVCEEFITRVKPTDPDIKGFKIK